MRYLFVITVAVCILIITNSCVNIQRRVQSVPATPQTQLQTREYQTRVFDTNNTKLIMKALLNVLQDDGFIVKNVVTDVGLLSATKEIDMKNQPKNSGESDFWSDLFSAMTKDKKNRSKNEEVTYMKLKIVEVSINISEFGLKSKVRANFQAKILDNKGNTVEVQTVDDPKFYQDFFIKVDKGIFIQKQGF